MWDADPILEPAVVAALPAVYVDLLRAVAGGVDDSTLAARLDIDVAAVPAAVRLAVAKLLAVQQDLRRP
jgi:hypothetical protein